VESAIQIARAVDQNKFACAHDLKHPLKSASSPRWEECSAWWERVQVRAQVRAVQDSSQNLRPRVLGWPHRCRSQALQVR
jgi:hypothetical protein